MSSAIAANVRDSQEAKRRIAKPVEKLGLPNSNSGQGTSIVVVGDSAELLPYVAAWEKLVLAAIEPNVFYEPWMLKPALRAFAAGHDLQFVLVFVPDPKRPFGDPILCGFFPLERVRNYKGLPIRALRLWQHRHCFHCTPLIHSEYARECLAAFFDWLAADARSAAIMEFQDVCGEGPFHQTLLDCCNERAALTCSWDCHTRALFRRRADAETFLGAALAGKHRRDFKRLEKRLSEIGRLEYATLEPGDDDQAWAEEFLRLETDGWKGQRGSALALNHRDRDFFLTSLGEASKSRRLLMRALRLNGRPIAISCAFLACPGAFHFKIAFDENYARFSPGVLLELDNIRSLHTQQELQWMDSCAIPNHFMINRLWLDRRTIQTLLVATGRGHGELALALLPALRWLKRKFARRTSTKSSV